MAAVASGTSLACQSCSLKLGSRGIHAFPSSPEPTPAPRWRRGFPEGLEDSRSRPRVEGIRRAPELLRRRATLHTEPRLGLCLRHPDPPAHETCPDPRGPEHGDEQGREVVVVASAREKGSFRTLHESVIDLVPKLVAD